MKYRQIRIEGKGPVRMWKVTDAETGDVIPVAKIELVATAEGADVAIYLHRVEIDLVTEAKVIEICPRCKEALQ